jgi:hypothetical protein
MARRLDCLLRCNLQTITLDGSARHVVADKSTYEDEPDWESILLRA